MNKIPMLEKFAAQSLVEHNGELIFSKEKFAEMIVRECADFIQHFYGDIAASSIGNDIKLHFGIEE